MRQPLWVLERSICYFFNRKHVVRVASLVPLRSWLCWEAFFKVNVSFTSIVRGSVPWITRRRILTKKKTNRISALPPVGCLDDSWKNMSKGQFLEMSFQVRKSSGNTSLSSEKGTIFALQLPFTWWILFLIPTHDGHTPAKALHIILIAQIMNCILGTWVHVPPNKKM